MFVLYAAQRTHCYKVASVVAFFGEEVVHVGSQLVLDDRGKRVKSDERIADELGLKTHTAGGTSLWFERQSEKKARSKVTE